MSDELKQLLSVTHYSSLLLSLMKIFILFAASALLLSLSLSSGTIDAARSVEKTFEVPAEKHLRNIRQLTFGGENAEAYFSAAQACV
jgi:hypothetical protein